jgi:hypothetical protein
MSYPAPSNIDLAAIYPNTDRNYASTMLVSVKGKVKVANRPVAKTVKPVFYAAPGSALQVAINAAAQSARERAHERRVSRILKGSVIHVAHRHASFCQLLALDSLEN